LVIILETFGGFEMSWMIGEADCIFVVPADRLARCAFVNRLDL